MIKKVKSFDDYVKNHQEFLDGFQRTVGDAMKFNMLRVHAEDEDKVVTDSKEILRILSTQYPTIECLLMIPGGIISTLIPEKDLIINLVFRVGENKENLIDLVLSPLTTKEEEEEETPEEEEAKDAEEESVSEEG